MAARIVLVGDSIIDNRAYVGPGELDVAAQIRTIMPGREVVMRAVDGFATRQVINEQARDLRDGDLVVLSSGGNDALGHIDLIAAATTAASAMSELSSAGPQTMVATILGQLRAFQGAFQADYSELLTALAQQGRHVLCLTIYNPQLAAHGFTTEQQRAAEAAISVFNDAIQREALRRGCSVLELRSLFTEAEDFANAIEPSTLGGAKIAEAVKRWVSSPPR